MVVVVVVCASCVRVAEVGDHSFVGSSANGIGVWGRHGDQERKAGDVALFILLR